MLSMTPAKPSSYRRGARPQSTPEWCAAVDRWLDDNGHDRAWLARQLGTHDAQVKRILDRHSRSSTYIPEIAKITNQPLPMLAILDSSEIDLVDYYRQLPKENQESFLSLFKSLASKQKGKPSP